MIIRNSSLRSVRTYTDIRNINKIETANSLILDDLKDTQMESDDEQPSVEHLAPQTLLETPDTDVQYSIKPSDGPVITYRVLQVQDASENFVTSGSSFTTASTLPEVIAGASLNGPIYVIGSTDGYASPTGSRPIAPRSAILEAPVVVQVKKKDEKRRTTHNEVERRRRDKINNWIGRLAKLLPGNPQEVKGTGQYDGHSKGGVLSKAYEYIIELQTTESRMGIYIKENKKLSNAVENLRSTNYALEAENAELRELLRSQGIEVKTST
ncbi:upstream stimulatory factor 2 isoform X1 [Dendroctonus ponderosae]|uniref:upstream stimulatory factor 2 isoform X1 n=1 Tax=Dendroctonus ponderosae TaxID=77166 RepID=UPI00203588E0|nr:upstream stimulatory factor 2 isoform X1 [Dendroctonus ponderosae]